MTSAAILLSRQPLRPYGRTPWVIKATEAVHWVKNNADSLYASTGMQTWELLVTLACQQSIKLKLVIPAADQTDFDEQCPLIASQYNLQPGLTEFIPVYPDNSPASNQQLRDEYIFTHADILIPVSVRENGHMAALLQKYSRTNKQVIDSFQCPYTKQSSPLHYKIDSLSLNPKIRDITNQYIIHWTRASNSAWPDEKAIDYYNAVLTSEIYPRDGLASLENILASRRIVASSRHMPGDTPTVSLSGASPDQFVPLMRYRARYRQMSFEPYGIGIEKELAHSIGIKPVYYYNKRDMVPKHQSEPWLMQSTGVTSDWRKEDEYRYPGDIDLSIVPAHSLVCFCYTAHEAEMIARTYSIKTISFIP